jgi:dTDP-4-dehydrorhamnose reductase
VKLLLFGADGQVGWELRRSLATLGDVEPVDRARCDLASPDAVRNAIRQAVPQVIVNAAAYTNVDKAESQKELATRINGQAPGVMAEEAQRLGIPLVHYSTDYVFDGKQSRPYLETDAVAPVNSYGYSKLRGEEAVRAGTEQHLLLRTSWVYAARGNNFLLTMLRLARQHKELKVVSDVVGAPTWARMIADATALALMGSLERRPPHTRLRDGCAGTYHVTASGSTSWAGFAEQIFNAACPDLAPDGVRVLPIPAREYPALAARPPNSVLATESFAQAFSLRLPDWRVGVDLCIAELRASRAARQGVGLAG